MITRAAVSLRARVGTELRKRLARRTAVVRCEPPIASFTFDDAPRSAFVEGARLLEVHGARGTFYISGGLIGRRDGDEPMLGAEELCELARRGHEIGCHTFDHQRPQGRARAEVVSDLSRNAEAISSVVAGVELSSFAYPFGELTLALKREAAARYATCRVARGGVNAGSIDLALLRATPLYGRALDRPALVTLLEAARRERGWLVFYTHEVRESPGRFGCTPEHLESAIRLMREAGVDILPVREALVRATVAAAVSPRR